MNPIPLKAGIVRGITRTSGRFEIAVALGGDQWIVARVDARTLAACKLAIGAPVLVDTGAIPFALRPWETRSRPACAPEAASRPQRAQVRSLNSVDAYHDVG
jgi:hypothetical protein